MKRYHIGRRGGISTCRAESAASCPLGPKHFASKAIAQFYVEAQQVTPSDTGHIIVPHGYTASKVTAQSLTRGDIIQFDDWGAYTSPQEVVKVERREVGVRLHTRAVDGGDAGAGWPSTHHPRTPIRKLTRTDQLPDPKTTWQPPQPAPAATRPPVRLTQAHFVALRDAVNIAGDEMQRFDNDAQHLLPAALANLRQGRLARPQINALVEAAEITLDGRGGEEPPANLGAALTLLRQL